MAKFIGNDIQTFDIEKIVVVWWSTYIDVSAKNVAHIIFIDGSEVYLHNNDEKDLILINALRKHFKQSPLSQKP